MKIMISQPMKGKTDNEIKKERNKIIDLLNLDKEDVIDTLFDFGDKTPLYYLSKSIEAMDKADCVIFAPGWELARGCKIEFEIATRYNKKIIILPRDSEI